MFKVIFREKYVYLMGRDPISINSNYYCFDHAFWNPTNVQTSRWALKLFILCSIYLHQPRDQCMDRLIILLAGNTYIMQNPFVAIYVYFGINLTFSPFFLRFTFSWLYTCKNITCCHMHGYYLNNASQTHSWGKHKGKS